MKIKRHRLQAGFTLIEILVALVILGFASGAVLSIFGTATLKVSKAENERLTVLAARSALALVGNEIPLESGTHQGQSKDGKFQWTVSVQPTETPSPLIGDAPRRVTMPYLVTVRTALGRESSPEITVTTVRLKSGAVP